MLKSAFIIPYVVELDDQFIHVSYLRNSIHVDIEIIDESGISVYFATVNPVEGGHLIIDIKDWPNGCYTIYFKEKNGDVVYGGFERQDFQLCNT